MREPTAKLQPRLKERLESICLEMIDKGILYSEAVEQFQNCFMAEIVSRHDGHLMRAAEQLGIHRNTLAKRLMRYKAKNMRKAG
jgi:Fis family transcriptional regulator, factor for inversion stimulation protein